MAERPGFRFPAAQRISPPCTEMGKAPPIAPGLRRLLPFRGRIFAYTAAGLMVRKGQMRKVAGVVTLGLAVALAPVSEGVARAEGLSLGRGSSKSQVVLRRNQFALLDGRLAPSVDDVIALEAPGGVEVDDIEE